MLTIFQYNFWSNFYWAIHDKIEVPIQCLKVFKGLKVFIYSKEGIQVFFDNTEFADSIWRESFHLLGTSSVRAMGTN